MKKYYSKFDFTLSKLELLHLLQIIILQMF